MYRPFPNSRSIAHQKSILVDDDRLFVGSMNFTENSAENCWEATMVTGASEVIQTHRVEYQKAMDASERVTIPGLERMEIDIKTRKERKSALAEGRARQRASWTSSASGSRDQRGEDVPQREEPEVSPGDDKPYEAGADTAKTSMGGTITAPDGTMTYHAQGIYFDVAHGVYRDVAV